MGSLWLGLSMRKQASKENELNCLEGTSLVVIKRDRVKENKFVNQLGQKTPFHLRRITDYYLSPELQSSFIIGTTIETDKLYQFSLDYIPSLIAFAH